MLVGAQSKRRRGAEADLYTAGDRENLSHRKRLRQYQRLAGRFLCWSWPRPESSEADLAPAFLNASILCLDLFRLSSAMSNAVLPPLFFKEGLLLTPSPTYVEDKRSMGPSSA